MPPNWPNGRGDGGACPGRFPRGAAKGRCGSLLAAYQLPVHLGGLSEPPMKAILPLIRSTLRGGLKVACGILVASVVIGGGVWGYSLYEERQEDELAQARHWDAKDVPALRATMKLKTKFDGS